ncbi:unnamed protein product [Cuscuta europaea]|uniref:Uncharacterized protein n=1 Tax=Cuscuta europaea TaxID=41803 RepID=A0A9P0YKF8_CUSEU|nr:unnamed protein product [Cuscuta europaea]
MVFISMWVRFVFCIKVGVKILKSILQVRLKIILPPSRNYLHTFLFGLSQIYLLFPFLAKNLWFTTILTHFSFLCTNLHHTFPTILIRVSFVLQEINMGRREYD